MNVWKMNTVMNDLKVDTNMNYQYEWLKNEYQYEWFQKTGMIKRMTTNMNDQKKRKKRIPIWILKQKEYQ